MAKNPRMWMQVAKEARSKECVKGGKRKRGKQTDKGNTESTGKPLHILKNLGFKKKRI